MDTRKAVSRRLAAITVSLLIAGPALARPAAPLRFGHLDSDDGLSQMNVLAIVQDSLGFLWLATQDGLNRYDGHDFFFVGGITGLLWLAADDGLWVGSPEQGLFRYDPLAQQVRSFRHQGDDAASPGSDRILALAGAARGGLWIGTERGLDYLDLGSERFERLLPASGTPATPVYGLAEDDDGTMWLATDNGLLRRDSDAGSLQPFGFDDDHPAPDPVSTLLRTRDGALWLGSAQGLDRFEPASGRWTRFRNHPQEAASLTAGGVSALLEDRAGTLWIGLTAGGLDRWRPGDDGGGFEHVRHDRDDPASIGPSTVASLYQDRSGVLWVGTTPGGAHYADPRAGRFERYRHHPERPESLGGEVVIGFQEDADGRLWVATWDGGLDRFDPASGRFEHFRHDPDDPHSLAHDRLQAIHLDAAGRLWVGTREHGLDRFDPASGRFQHFRHHPDDPHSLSDDRVRSFADHPDGRLWIATQGGLDRFDPRSGRFEHFHHDPEVFNSLSSDRLQHLFARDGTLWISTWGAGVDSLDLATGRFQHFRHDPGNPRSLSDNTIRSVYVDSGGRLWVSTDGSGLDLLSAAGQGFAHFSQADGLANDVVHGVLEDDRGRIWISTNGGLSHFDPERGTWATYDAADGLQHAEFNFGAFHRGASGRMYFGGIRGFNAFDPRDFERDTQPPRTVLTSFQGLGLEIDLPRALPYLESLELEHHQNAFSFEVAVLSFVRADRNRYRYLLEGFDRTWIEAGARRFASYTNVPPGSYRLRVRGAGRDGVWSEQDGMLRLRIARPPWRTLWAYAFYGLAITAAIGGYVRWQRREVAREREIVHRLREVDRIKDTFLANTSHELRTPLFGITGLAEALADGARGTLPAQARQDLGMIAASGHRLAGLVNDILDYSKLERGRLQLRRRPVELQALTEVVLSLSRPLVERDAVMLINAVSPDLPPAWADEERLQQILHNLIGNAIKFTTEGRIEITAEVDGEHLAVTVSDTGIGIDAEHQERVFNAFEQADASIERSFGGTGLGLTVTRRLVELHGGRLRVRSQPDQGSAFTFTVPIARGDQLADTDDRPAAIARPAWDADHARPRAEVAAVQTEMGADRARVLVVDDEPINRLVLANHLAAEGYLATQASSGAEALQLVAAHPFDLVLLDIMMPKMSGYEVCRALRSHHPVQELPVIFLTAKSQESDRVAGFAEGANDYLTKPVAKGELLARVRTHLQLLAAYRRQENEVKVLSGLLPICATCKRIRDDAGYWNQLESFLLSHTGVSFTHSLCPSCAEDLARQDPQPSAEQG